jgi:hypothetical protein
MKTHGTKSILTLSLAFAFRVVTEDNLAPIEMTKSGVTRRFSQGHTTFYSVDYLFMGWN